MDRIILNQMNDCWSHVMRTVRMVLSVQSITRDLEFVYSPHQRPAGFLTYRSSIQNTFPVSQWMCGLSTLACIGAVFWNLISKKTASLLTVTSSYRSCTCFPFTCFDQDMEIYSWSNSTERYYFWLTITFHYIEVNYSAFTAQRIFVDLALPFCAHSCADGRTTSLAYSE